MRDPRAALATAMVLCALLGAAASLRGGETADAAPPSPMHGSRPLDPGAASCDLCHDPSSEGGAGGSGGERARPAAPAPPPSFRRYSSPKMQARFAGLSRTTVACLRCHADLARNGLGDHPVGFAYDSALAARDGALRDPASAPSGLGGTVERDLLENGTLQCTSCHVFHADSSEPGREPKLLRLPQRPSTLCRACHDL